MLHVKNAVHVLRLKWMDRLCKDVRSSWSRWIWPQMEEIFGFHLITGVHAVHNSALSGLTPFYAAMVRSFVYVNDIFYRTSPDVCKPWNL